MALPRYLVLLLLLALPLEAASARLRFRSSKSATSLNVRRRLSARPERAVERSFAVDWSQAAGVDGSWLSPLTVTYQASGKLDFSLNFDTFERHTSAAGIQASNYYTLAATRTAVTAGGVELGVMPQLTVLHRDAEGVRAVASLLARWNKRGHSLGGSFTWTGATSPSPDNPAGLAETGVGYGRQIRRVLLHANFTAERGSAAPWVSTMLEGVQVRVRQHWSVDLSGQHHGLGTGVEHRVMATVSWTSAAVLR